MLLLFIGAASTGLRYRRYRREKVPVPLLLGRDVTLMAGLTLPFLAILIVRAFGVTSIVTGDGGPEVWWLLLTGVPALIAIGVYVYFELFVIERH